MQMAARNSFDRLCCVELGVLTKKLLIHSIIWCLQKTIISNNLPNRIALKKKKVGEREREREHHKTSNHSIKKKYDHFIVCR